MDRAQVGRGPLGAKHRPERIIAHRPVQRMSRIEKPGATARADRKYKLLLAMRNGSAQPRSRLFRNFYVTAFVRRWTRLRTSSKRDKCGKWLNARDLAWLKIAKAR